MPAHLLTAAAALAAFVLVLGLLGRQPAQRSVLVAAVDLPAGSRLTAEVVTAVDVAVAPALDSLLAGDHPVGGAVVSHRIRAGVPLRFDDLAAGVGPGGEPARQLLSIPVEPEHAVGGQLQLLDHVDLIAVEDGAARLVASELPIVDLPAIDTGPFGGGAWYVTVEVAADQALPVAAAVAGGSVQLARSAAGSGS